VRTREFAVTEVPKPSPGPGEVLVRVAASHVRVGTALFGARA